MSSKEFEDWANENTRTVALRCYRLIFCFTLVSGQFSCLFGFVHLFGSDKYPGSWVFYFGPVQIMVYVLPKGVCDE